MDREGDGRSDRWIIGARREMRVDVDAAMKWPAACLVAARYAAQKHHTRLGCDRVVVLTKDSSDQTPHAYDLKGRQSIAQKNMNDERKSCVRGIAARMVDE
jgi:hypothetical protein